MYLFHLQKWFYCNFELMLIHAAAVDIVTRLFFRSFLEKVLFILKQIIIGFEKHH